MFVQYYIFYDFTNKTSIKIPGLEPKFEKIFQPEPSFDLMYLIQTHPYTWHINVLFLCTQQKIVIQVVLPIL